RRRCRAARRGVGNGGGASGGRRQASSVSARRTPVEAGGRADLLYGRRRHRSPDPGARRDAAGGSQRPGRRAPGRPVRGAGAGGARRGARGRRCTAQGAGQMEGGPQLVRTGTHPGAPPQAQRRDGGTAVNILVYLIVFFFFVVLFVAGVKNSFDVTVNLV